MKTNPIYDDKTKQTASDMIKFLYHNMPTYNQLKGTYSGIQMILNLMGLCSRITELWSPRTTEALTNFVGDQLYRADYLNAVRQRIEEWGNATVENYFLTSRFDVDITEENVRSFKTFNGMAGTIITTILQMKPVTRCLRYLYYIITINTDIHYEYQTYYDTLKSEDNSDRGGKIRNYRYMWDVVVNPLVYKSKVDKRNNTIYSLFLPWNSIRAAYIDLDEGKETHTLKNTYFNLFEMGRRFEISKQKTFRFKLEGCFADKTYDPADYTKVFVLEIGKDVDFDVETNGINVIFKGTATTIFTDLFGKLNDIFIVSEQSYNTYLRAEGDASSFLPENALTITNETNDNLNDGSILLKFTSVFSTVLGSKYLYQNDDIPLEFGINYEGIISEINTRLLRNEAGTLTIVRESRGL